MTKQRLKAKSLEYWKHWYCIINASIENPLIKILIAFSILPENHGNFHTEWSAVETFLEENGIDTHKLLDHYEDGTIKYKPSDFNNY